MWYVIIALTILIIFIYMKSENLVNFVVEPAEGNSSYVRFYSDFNWSNLLFKMEQGPTPKYIKYDLKGDAKSMDINLPDTGIPGQRVEVWARYPDKDVGTTLTDFYNVYNIPEYDYSNMTNLQLVARVLPGQRYKSQNIAPSKRFLIKALL